jgi:EAL domain-containing protein (putative c-di-GMP-specific phosphodiesterase class I)
MIAMAHALGLEVVAEGVETAAQRDFLAQSACDLGQGYLFARPLPPADVTVLLAAPSSFLEDTAATSA